MNFDLWSVFNGDVPWSSSYAPELYETGVEMIREAQRDPRAVRIDLFRIGDYNYWSRIDGKWGLYAPKLEGRLDEEDFDGIYSSFVNLLLTLADPPAWIHFQNKMNSGESFPMKRYLERKADEFPETYQMYNFIFEQKFQNLRGREDEEMTSGKRRRYE